MKRLFLFIAIMTLAISSQAQKGLAVNEVFESEYAEDPRATLIELNGGALGDYGLSEYRSLTLVDAPADAPDIEQLLRSDGARAVEKEVTYRNGGIYFAFYQLSPKKGLNRYLFYLNTNRASGNKIMLIYMAGTASPAEIKSFIKNIDSKK